MKKIILTALAALLIGGCGASGAQFALVEKPELSGDSGRIYFYRPGKFVGAAIQPAIMLNGKRIGKTQPGGFFFVDVPAGNYEVATTTEVEKKLTFRLRAGEMRYVRFKVGLGIVAGRVYPELANESEALGELANLKQMDG